MFAENLLHEMSYWPMLVDSIMFQNDFRIVESLARELCSAFSFGAS